MESRAYRRTEMNFSRNLPATEVIVNFNSLNKRLVARYSGPFSEFLEIMKRQLQELQRDGFEFDTPIFSINIDVGGDK